MQGGQITEGAARGADAVSDSITISKGGPGGTLGGPCSPGGGAAGASGEALGTVTALGATLIVGIGVMSVGTEALLRHGATSSSVPTAVAVARVVTAVSEAREVIDAGAPAAARPAAPTNAPANPPPPPHLAIVTASADRWGTLSIDGQHVTESWAT